MKKLLLVLVIVLLIGAAVWAYFRFVHVTKAGDVYLQTVSAAMLGDEDGFLDGFTPESRPVLAALLRLSRTRDPRLASTHPYYYLVTEQIESVGEPQKGPDGKEEVWLTLKRAGDRGVGTEYSVRMVEIDRAWKIDALSFTGKKHVVDQTY